MHHHALDVRASRKLKHRVAEHFFHDGSQATGTGSAVKRQLGDGLKCLAVKLKRNAVVGKKLLVLQHQRVARLGEDAHEVIHAQLVRVRDDGDAAHQLGDQPKAMQVLRLNHRQQLVVFQLGGRGVDGGKTDAVVGDASAHDVGQPHKRAAANKEHVGGIELVALLEEIGAPAQRRHARHRALQQLQQRLLHALARRVAVRGHQRGVARACDFVNLVDVHDARLGILHTAGRGNQPRKDLLHVIAHIASVSQRGGVCDGERHVQNARERLHHQRFACSRGSQKQDVRLRDLHRMRRVLVPSGRDALVVVVHGHRERAPCVLLPNHVRAQRIIDLLRGRDGAVGTQRGSNLHLGINGTPGFDVAAHLALSPRFCSGRSA